MGDKLTSSIWTTEEHSFNFTLSAEKPDHSSCNWQHLSMDISADNQLKSSCRRNPYCSDDISVGSWGDFHNTSFEALKDIDEDGLKERAIITLQIFNQTSYTENQSYTHHRSPERWEWSLGLNTFTGGEEP